MGSIIIANMQAQLTLDKRDFDQGADAAEKRIAQLQGLGKSLPGAQTSNVGKDQQADPAQQQRQIDRVQQAQDHATQQTQITQLAALQQASASDQENAHRRSKAAFQDLVQAHLTGLQQIGAAADTAKQKVQAVSTAASQAVAPTVSQVQQVLAAPREYIGPIHNTNLDRNAMIAQAHAHRLATQLPQPVVDGPQVTRQSIEAQLGAAGFTMPTVARGLTQEQLQGISGGIVPTLKDFAARGYKLPSRVAFTGGANAANLASYDSDHDSLTFDATSPVWARGGPVGKPGFAAVNTPQGVVAHEFGHNLTPSSTGVSWGSDTERLLAGNVSQYAATNPREFVAETFAGLQSGKTYNANIMGMYGRYGGKGMLPPSAVAPAGAAKGPWENSYSGLDSYQEDAAERAKADAYFAKLKASPLPPRAPGTLNYPGGFVPSGVAIADAGLPQASNKLTGADLDAREKEIAALNPNLSADEVHDLVQSLSAAGGDRSKIRLALPGVASKPAPAAAAHPTAAHAPAEPGGQPAHAPHEGGRPGGDPEMRGARDLRREFYLERWTPIEMGASRALEPFSPTAVSALPLFAGGVLGAITAIGLFAIAIKSATDAAMEHSKAEFALSVQTKAYGGSNALLFSGQGAGALTPGYEAMQQRRQVALGYGKTTTTQELAALAPYVQDQAGTTRVMQDIADFARAQGMPIEQATSLFTQLSQGNAGGFHQYMPNVFQGATQGYVLSQVEQRYGGTAQAFMQTPQGQQEKAGADWNEFLTKIGTDLVPAENALVSGLDAIIPVVADVVTAFGTIITPVADAVGAMTKFAAWALHFIPAEKPENQSTGVFGTILGALAPGGAGAAIASGKSVLGNVDTNVGRGVAPAVGLFSGAVPGGSAVWDPVLQAYTTDQPAPRSLASIAAAQVGKPTGLSGELKGGLAVDAVAQITAMQQIAQEVQNTETAITGVQKVFSQLTTFHVDMGMVKGNLKNLEDAVIVLEDFWVSIATSKAHGVDQGDYQHTTTWLNMVSAMVTLMSGSSDMFAKLYANSGEMPTPDKTALVMTRLEDMYSFVHDVAEQMTFGQDDSRLKLDNAAVQGYSDAMNSLVSFVSAGSDALTKIFTLPIPSPSTVKGATDAIVGMTKAVAVDLVGAFFTTIGTYAGNGQISYATSVDPLLSQSAAVVDNATKLIGFANTGIQAIQGMRDITIPSSGEISTIVDRIMGMSDQVALAIKDSIAKGHPGNQSQSVDQFGLIPNPKAGVDDPTMKAAADNAANQTKMLQFVQAGVGALAGMRDLSIPSQGFVDEVVTRSITMVQSAVNKLPPVDGTALAKMTAYGQALAPMMQAVGSAVGALANMRNLAEPSGGQVSKVIGNLLSMGETIGAAAQSYTGTQTDKMRDFGNALNAEMGALSTGADVLKKIRDLPVPSGFSLANFKQAFDAVAAQFTPEAVGTAQATADRMKDWGQGMGPMFQALSSGADFLKAVGSIILPTHQQLDSVWEAESYMAAQAKYAAEKTTPEMEADVKLYGEAMSAAFGAMNAGGDFLQRVVAQPPIPKSMIDKYFVMLGEVTVDFSAGMAGWIKNQNLENAKYAPELQAELDSMTAGTDFLLKLGTLKPDYTAAITGYFAQLNLAVTLFQAELPKWQKGMTSQTSTLATNVKTEMDALNSALDPFTKMETAAQIRPEQIELAFNNSRQAMGKFLGLMNSPELQGDKLGSAVQFSKAVTDIFGAMKTTVDAVDVLNQPGYQTNSGTFGQVMNDFFLKAVPLYASTWSQAMGQMGNDAENMAGRTIGAIGGTPQAQYLSPSSKAMVATNQRGGYGGGAGAGGTYTNCIFVGQDLIASDPNVANLIMSLTKNETVKNGGLPVGANR